MNKSGGPDAGHANATIERFRSGGATCIFDQSLFYDADGAGTDHDVN